MKRWHMLSPLFWQPLSLAGVTPVGGTLPFLPGYLDKCTQIQDKYTPQICWDKCTQIRDKYTTSLPQILPQPHPIIISAWSMQHATPLTVENNLQQHEGCHIRPLHDIQNLKYANPDKTSGRIDRHGLLVE